MNKLQLACRLKKLPVVMIDSQLLWVVSILYRTQVVPLSEKPNLVSQLCLAVAARFDWSQQATFQARLLSINLTITPTDEQNDCLDHAPFPKWIADPAFAARLFALGEEVGIECFQDSYLFALSVCSRGEQPSSFENIEFAFWYRRSFSFSLTRCCELGSGP